MANHDQPHALDVATKLAIERTRVAYDRTMMAWIRTGTSLITFGFSVYKFFQLDRHRPPPPAAERFHIGYHEFSMFLVLVGLCSLVIGSVEHKANMRDIKALDPTIRSSRISIVAALVSLLGILALIAVVVRF